MIRCEAAYASFQSRFPGCDWRSRSELRSQSCGMTGDPYVPTCAGDGGMAQHASCRVWPTSPGTRKYIHSRGSCNGLSLIVISLCEVLHRHTSRLRSASTARPDCCVWPPHWCPSALSCGFMGASCVASGHEYPGDRWSCGPGGRISRLMPGGPA